MLSFTDFDAWSDAIRGADLGLVCDGVEVRSWRLAVRNLGRVVVQSAFEGGGNLCVGANTWGGPILFMPLTHGGHHVVNCRQLDASSLLLIPPGADFRIQVRRRAHEWCSLALPADFPLNAGLDGLHLFATSRVIRVATPALDRLRRLVVSTALEPALDGPHTPAHDAAVTDLLTAATACLGQVAVEPTPLGRPKIDRAAIVRRAVSLLEEGRVPRPSVVDIARHCGVNKRTLGRAFHDTFGVSPLAYSRLRLVHQVRRRLRAAREADATVAAVLTAHGIWDFGRFAALYRRQFGEAPADTLRQRPA
jgi:AraC family transcriptional regulator, ethanolamine operon transcriptional activator